MKAGTFFAAAVALALTAPVHGQVAQSSNYKLATATTANGGGTSVASSANYALKPASLEGTARQISTSATYTLKGGWVPQNTSNCPEYDAWVAAKLPANPLNRPIDDPDGDGSPNLLEFAFNSNPLSGAAPFPYTVQSVPGGGLSVSFQRVAGCLAYRIEFTDSFEITDWAEVIPPAFITAITPAAGGMENVTVFVPQATAGRQIFLRMRVTMP